MSELKTVISILAIHYVGVFWLMPVCSFVNNSVNAWVLGRMYTVSRMWIVNSHAIVSIFGGVGDFYYLLQSLKTSILTSGHAQHITASKLTFSHIKAFPTKMRKVMISPWFLLRLFMTSNMQSIS